MSRLEAKTTAGPAVPHPFPYQGEQAGTHQVHPALLSAGHRSLYTPAGLRRGRGSSNPRPPARIDWNGGAVERRQFVRPRVAVQVLLVFGRPAATHGETGGSRCRRRTEMLMPPPVSARESRHASFSGVPMAMRSYSTGGPRVVDPAGPIHSSWQPATRAPTTRPSSTTPQASAGDSGICEIDGSLGRDSVAPGQPVAAPASASADPLGQADDRDFADLAHIGRAVGG